MLVIFSMFVYQFGKPVTVSICKNPHPCLPRSSKRWNMPWDPWRHFRRRRSSAPCDRPFALFFLLVCLSVFWAFFKAQNQAFWDWSTPKNINCKLTGFHFPMTVLSKVLVSNGKSAFEITHAPIACVDLLWWCVYQKNSNTSQLKHTKHHKGN